MRNVEGQVQQLQAYSNYPQGKNLMEPIDKQLQNFCRGNWELLKVLKILEKNSQTRLYQLEIKITTEN